MREDERPALIHVALETRLLRIVCLVEHLGGLAHSEGGCEPAMRVVAVSAVDQALIHSMLARQIVLRSHVGVALVAGLWLAFGEQVLGRPWVVNGMAGGARNVVLGMLRAPDVSAIELLGVAGKAPADDFLRLHYAERIHDRLDIAARIHVRLPRTVAPFAAGPLWWLFARSNAFVVRVLVKTVPDRIMFVTVPASRIARIFALHRCSL
jgi:hypothetical protein